MDIIIKALCNPAVCNCICEFICRCDYIDCLCKGFQEICCNCIFKHLSSCCSSFFQSGFCNCFDTCCIAIFRNLTCLCNCSISLQNCLNTCGYLAFNCLRCWVCFCPNSCLRTIGYRKRFLKQDNERNRVDPQANPIGYSGSLAEITNEPLVHGVDAGQAIEYAPNHGQIYSIMPMRN